MSRLVLFGLVALAACVGEGVGLDPNGDPIGNVPPPPPAVSFSQDVQPIFTTNCAFSGCHAGASPAVGLNLSPGLALQNIVNVQSVQSPLLRVRPSEPDESYLVHKIQGTQLGVGGTGGRMPLIGGPLSSSEIDLIRDWVADGAQDN